MATYELMYVARANQPSGPPSFDELWEIPGGKSWTGRLRHPGELQAGVPLRSIPESLKERLLYPAQWPAELWLRRDGVKVQAGPYLGWQAQGRKTLTLHAVGLLGYLEGMWLTANLTFTQADRFTIARQLVEHWQNLSYGHFGIYTDQIGTSGALHTVAYAAAERHNVWQKLSELAAAEDGFDFRVDPQTRHLMLDHPQAGVDRSENVVLDVHNIAEASATTSIAPGDFASEIYATGTGGGSATLVSQQTNLDVRTRWGRWGTSATFDGVTSQATLDGYARVHLSARDRELFVPPGKIIPVPDADVDDFAIGDTVGYAYDVGLGLQVGSLRVPERTVSIDPDGGETMTVKAA